ncbi:MAG TPA: glycoside hydrolase family 15 protein, partial [Acidimicrobiia bacterium]|nr:glycoside hydrolase family 15 protein [Acidimicrobiia bacterium]
MSALSNQPIADHALISDCHSAALVDLRGSIEWWCLPRFDSPSVFARILDDSGGHFSITPTDRVGVTRRYQDGSLVLVTTFDTATGMVEITDTLAMAEGVRGHDLGQDSPHVLLRHARCLDGRVELDIEFAPRFEYGLTFPLVSVVEGGLIARGGAATLCLSTPCELRIERRSGVGRIGLAAGERASFAVTSGSSWEALPVNWNHDRIEDLIEDTVAAWRSWGDEHQRYQGPYADLVTHSGRVLQGMTYQPTGAVVAAPTTSLPEVVGGERNWDYRYAWVRDSSFTLNALWVAACPDEATSFLSFLATAASSFLERQELQIMFGIRGERDLSERVLPWLEGWRGSQPVRVGNGAWAQHQLDVYGEMLAAIHRLQSQFPVLSGHERDLLAGLADVAARVWMEKDHGIWEIRGEPRHYLYSKLMCWVALDRAADMADLLHAEDRVDDWQRAREEIRSAILEQGWNEQAGAFTQAFGTSDLDASNLVIPQVGFLPPNDPKVLATIETTEERLTDKHGLVYRYRSADGFEGEEGTFLLCTFWLSEALALADRVDRAREVFEMAISHVNDVGLLAEEVDPDSGELLGNFPQAFSHIGLVNAAWA